MAEVRPIPSAVGAFEAQVIDFNKTYKAIVDNASAIRKRQAQAQKDIEKQMDVSLADKRAIRPQDSDYVEEKRQDVYNYYFQNRDNIMAGGKAAGELKMKMGEFTSAVNQSSSLNRRGMSLNPAWKEAMKDENQMDDGLTEVQRVWSLPINDPKRKDAKFDRGGFQASIDEFDVPDISYYKKFNEIKDIYDPITKNVKPYTVETMRLTTNPKIGKYVDQTTKLQLYNPTEIVNTVTAAVSGSKSRGFLSDYGKQLAVYKSIPQEDKDLELKGVIEAYKDLEGTDMSSWFAKQGGTAGIDNELELAAFKQLQNNLPQLVKDTYDYRTQSMLMRQWQYDLSVSKFNYKQEQEEQLDLIVSRAIKSGKFNPDEWNAYYKPFTNASNSATGNVRSADINFSKEDANGNITVTLQTQTPILDADGKYITDKNQAQASQMVAGKAGTKAVISYDGLWYAQNNKTIVINRKTEPESVITSKITGINDQIENAINLEAAQKSFQSVRNKKTLLKEEMPGANPKPSVRASGSSVNKKAKSQ